MMPLLVHLLQIQEILRLHTMNLKQMRMQIPIPLHPPMQLPIRAQMGKLFMCVLSIKHLGVLKQFRLH